MIVLTVVAVVAVISLILSRRTEERGTAEFLAAAEQATELQSGAAERLGRVFGEVGPLLSRQEVVTFLSEAVAATADAGEFLDMEVPTRAARSYGYLSAASEAWMQGAAEAERTIVGLMNGDLDEDGPTALREVIALLRAGDTAYALFTADVAGLDTESAMADFPEIHFIDPEPSDPVRYDEQQLALRISLAYNLAPQIDLGVVGTIVPEPVGARGGIPVVPASDSLGVTGVVTNFGNEPQGAFSVTLTVLDVDTGEIDVDSTSLEALQPGASTTAAFESISVAPGGLYQVTLTVTIADDGDTSNNTWAMTFIWNEES